MRVWNGCIHYRPVPVDAGLVDHHAYRQVIVLGTTGAANPALDLNIQL